MFSLILITAQKLSAYFEIGSHYLQFRKNPAFHILWLNRHSHAGLIPQAGYTFTCEGRTHDGPLTSSKYRLRLVGTTPELLVPTRDISSTSVETNEVKEYYTPQRHEIMFRFVERGEMYEVGTRGRKCWNKGRKCWNEGKVNCESHKRVLYYYYQLQSTVLYTSHY